MPSSSSSDAPPPVETKVTLSSMSNLAAAVAESPPPMMPLLPAGRRLGHGVEHRLGALGEGVELEDAGRAVPDDGRAREDLLAEELHRLGPAVHPLPAVGDPLLLRHQLRRLVVLELLPHSQSHGKTISQPLAFALAISLGTSSAPFLSKSDLPIGHAVVDLEAIFMNRVRHCRRCIACTRSRRCTAVDRSGSRSRGSCRRSWRRRRSPVSGRSDAACAN